MDQIACRLNDDFHFEFGSFMLAEVVGITAENLSGFIVYSLGLL